MLGDLSFTRKVEFNDISLHSYVLRPQRRQAVAAIFISVHLTAGTHETSGQDPQDTCHDSLAAKILPPQIVPHDSAHPWHRLTKFQQTVELLVLPLLYVIFMIDILPASGGIFADGLKHSAGGSIDRYLSPGGREAKCIDAGQVGASYFAAIRGFVSEAALSSQSPDACSLKSF